MLARADEAGHRRGRPVGQEDEHGEAGGQDGVGDGHARQLVGAEVADDGGVGQAVERLGDQRPEGGQCQPVDVPVVGTGRAACHDPTAPRHGSRDAARSHRPRRGGEWRVGAVALDHVELDHVPAVVAQAGRVAPTAQNRRSPGSPVVCSSAQAPMRPLTAMARSSGSPVATVPADVDVLLGGRPSCGSRRPRRAWTVRSRPVVGREVLDRAGRRGRRGAPSDRSAGRGRRPRPGGGWASRSWKPWSCRR